MAAKAVEDTATATNPRPADVAEIQSLIEEAVSLAR
jgi:alcohol dehydrogenase class IV